MPIERIPTDTVPAHVGNSLTAVQTGVNSDTDTGAALFVDALGSVYVHVRRGTAEPAWYQADTMAAAADFYGRLMATDAFTAPDVLAQRVSEDETVCPVCWGIRANGAVLVPDDGTPCTCDAPGSENVRYWIDGAHPDDGHARPYGDDTVGIVDNEEGGVIAYVHRETADSIIAALIAAREA